MAAITLDEDATVAMYAALVLMLGVARALGELARKYKQPSIIGELLSGLVVGKTLLGNVWPDAWDYLYKKGQAQAVGLSAVVSVAASLFMLVSGLEVKLSQIVRRKRETAIICAFIIVLPFLTGFGAAMLWPGALGRSESVSVTSYAVFLGGHMSVTSLPVVAKTVRDMGLVQTNVGILGVASAVVCSVVAVIVALAPSSEGDELARNVVLSVVFVAAMLTVVRALVHRLLPWVQAKLTWPNGVIGMLGLVMLASAAFSTWLRLHATIGGFVAGAAFGETPHLRDSTRRTVDQFVSSVFVPIFFASTGIYVDFINDFEPGLVFLILFLSFSSKLLGGYAAARLSGIDRRDSMALATIVNSRGSIAIVVASAALKLGLIDNRVYVAELATAIASSLVTGPLLSVLIPRVASPPFTDYVKARRFFPLMTRESKEAALRQLALSAADVVPDALALLAEEERRLARSGEGPCVADRVVVPVVRVLGLNKPAVALGFSREGLAYVAEDEGESVQVVVMALLPDRLGDQGVASFVSEVRAVLSSPEVRETFLNCTTLHELRANMQVAKAHLAAFPKLSASAAPRDSTALGGASSSSSSISTPVARSHKAAGHSPDGHASTLADDSLDGRTAERSDSAGSALELTEAAVAASLSPAGSASSDEPVKRRSS